MMTRLDWPGPEPKDRPLRRIAIEIAIFILIALSLLTLDVFTAKAHAQTKTRFLLGPGTYAARALCPPTLNLMAWPNLTATGSPLGPPNQFCVNGRIGITFTVPPGPARNVLITLGEDPILIDPKVRINRDCAEGLTTTCTTKHVIGTRVATASGVFTYPGDVDWILLPDDGLYTTIRFATTPGCYASGRVAVGLGDGRQYLIAMGGPAACTYTVTAVFPPEEPEYD